MTPIELAVEIAGGQAALARAIGGEVKQQHVWYWLNKGAAVPAEHCGAIEAATNGRVTRKDLRPDVFGPLPVSEPTSPQRVA
jgi:DNA-binding transcriptional regulator YdaS (Cro superfamily)